MVLCILLPVLSNNAVLQCGILRSDYILEFWTVQLFKVSFIGATWNAIVPVITISFAKPARILVQFII